MKRGSASKGSSLLFCTHSGFVDEGIKVSIIKYFFNRYHRLGGLVYRYAGRKFPTQSLVVSLEKPEDFFAPRHVSAIGIVEKTWQE